MKTVEICTRENSDGANKTVEIAVDRTYTKEGFLCHRKEVLSWNHQGQCGRGRAKKKKGMEENNRGGRWKNGKNLERCQGKSWKRSLLDLFHAGHMLGNGGTGIDLNLYLIHKL
jgi:hypothetical protein